MSVVLGVDGGGTNLRVALVDERLDVLAEAHGESVNPSVVGQALAAQRIQEGISQALRAARLAPEHVAAAGIGVAGAAVEHSAAWLTQTLRAALPASRLALSSDVEIALVGAHGQRLGILLLAGTGSCGYGVNAAGESALVGGWGYLIGDEGSGYWLGRQALKTVAQIADEKRRDPASQAFREQVLDFLEIRDSRKMIKWIYGDGAPAPRIATLAPLVLALAQNGNPHAVRIATLGVLKLVDYARTLQLSLDLIESPIAFAGGLLEKSPYYRGLLAEHLNIDIPQTLYPPVLGAAILAWGTL